MRLTRWTQQRRQQQQQHEQYWRASSGGRMNILAGKGGLRKRGTMMITRNNSCIGRGCLLHMRYLLYLIPFAHSNKRETLERVNTAKMWDQNEIGIIMPTPYEYKAALFVVCLNVVCLIELTGLRRVVVLLVRSREKIRVEDEELKFVRFR